ncbi:MAG: hypothetical protein ABSH49_11350 [Bryobacteraceae bacterium]
MIQAGDLLEVSGDKPGWGCLERLERIRAKNYKDRSPLEQQHSKFLDDSIPLMLTVKDLRHKIEHVNNKLVWLDPMCTPEIAEEIISATRGLMRRLASDLP